MRDSAASRSSLSGHCCSRPARRRRPGQRHRARAAPRTSTRRSPPSGRLSARRGQRGRRRAFRVEPSTAARRARRDVAAGADGRGTVREMPRCTRRSPDRRRPARGGRRLVDADRARAGVSAAGGGTRRVDSRLAASRRRATRASPIARAASAVLRQDGWEIVYDYADAAARTPVAPAHHISRVRDPRGGRRVALTADLPRAAHRPTTPRGAGIATAAGRAGAGEAQSVPARDRSARRRLPHARIAVRRARFRRHAHAHLPRRRRDRAHPRAARRRGRGGPRGARRARAAAGNGDGLRCRHRDRQADSARAAGWAAAVPTPRRCCSRSIGCGGSASRARR